MSLCDAQSVPVCPSFPFLRALSHLPGVFPLFTLRLTQHHVYPKQRCNSRLFELTTGPPYTSENSHPQKTSLHITHHPKELSPLQAEGCVPCFLLAEPHGKQARTQRGEMGGAPIKNATHVRFSYSKFNGITLSKVSCNWPLVSLQSTEMAALEKQCRNKNSIQVFTLFEPVIPVL